VHQALVLVLASLLTSYLGIRYWRAMLWSASRYRLSEATRDLGAWIDGPQGEQALSVICALLKVCPKLERGSDQKILVVRAYDRFLKFLQSCMRQRGGEKWPWIAAERRACAYFAAVLLDQRITRTTQWYAGQVSGAQS
jgi:hypothetical protein